MREPENMGAITEINEAMSEQGGFGSKTYIRSQMRVRITIWLVVFTVCSISACGNSENSNIREKNNKIIKEVILYSPDKEKNHYISCLYLVNITLLMVKVAWCR